MGFEALVTCLLTLKLVSDFVLIGQNLTARPAESRRSIRGGIQIRETWLQAVAPCPCFPPELARRLTLDLKSALNLRGCPSEKKNRARVKFKSSMTNYISTESLINVVFNHREPTHTV